MNIGRITVHLDIDTVHGSSLPFNTASLLPMRADTRIRLEANRDNTH